MSMHTQSSRSTANRLYPTSIAIAAAALLAAATLLLATPAHAQSDPSAASTSALTGTLAKARDSGVVTIGYREASIPFSYVSARNEPIGYSIELCKMLVTGMSAAVNKPLDIKWVPVTSDSRIGDVASGKVDMECGSTTNNLERQKQVSFSPTIFVSGTKLLVKQNSPVKSFRDLVGKTVSVTRGTTNEKAMRSLSDRFKLNLNIVVTREHSESFAMVTADKADAFATDDVLLYGLIAESKGKVPGDYQVVGEFLSYEPYAIMFRKGDAQMTAVVDSTMQALAGDGEIGRQYERWFLQKLPSGTSIDLPMSPQLDTIIQTMGVKAD
jgi:ABC-type amino acid transport substrate-binding protein